jgi:glutamate--cysteine ligase
MSRQVAADATPIENVEQLLAMFRGGAKPRSTWGTGIEYERIGLFTETGETVPYAGHPSVSAVLAAMAAGHGWTPIHEGENLVELQRAGAAVSLEPGSQLEFAGSVHRDLSSLGSELCGFMADAEEVAAPLGIRWAAIGLNPFTPVERIGWIPKARYKVMARRLALRGRLAHHMMKATAGIQGNFDYASEEDAVEKLRLATAVTSLTTAMVANSPLYAGAPNDFQSMRAFIWLDTDPDRCGLLQEAFRPEAGFQAYLDYALAIPVLFIVRDGRWIDMEGFTFRRFLDEGREGWRATLADWRLHLTTLFPEVRLKTYLEVRGADSVSCDLAIALMALWKGLLYGDRARDDAWRLVGSWSWAERQQLHRDICSHGLYAKVAGRSAAEVAGDLVTIAAAGLGETRAVEGGADEIAALDPLRTLIEDPGARPAEQILRGWDGEWRRSRAQLVEHVSQIRPPCAAVPRLA